MYYFTDSKGNLKLQHQYVDEVTGKRKYITVTVNGTSNKAKHEAMQKLNDKIDHLTCKQHRLSGLISAFLAEQKVTMKLSTYRKSKYSLGVFLRVVGDVDLDKLTSGYIRTQIMKNKIKPSTANEYLTKWKACLRWGYKNDFLSDLEVVNKLENFKEETSRKERIKDKYLETKEMKLLLDSMDDIERNKLFTQFLLLTGMRVGEAIALDRSDIGKKYIHVTKTYDINNNIITTPKTLDSTRDVYIQTELRNLITEIVDFMQKQEKYYGYPHTEYLFTNHLGNRMSYNFYRRYLKDKSKYVGKKVTAHTLRHTHTSMLAAQGVPIEVISRRLGHSNSKITREVYFHVLKELKEKENDMIKDIRLFD